MLNAWLLRDSFLTDSGDQWTSLLLDRRTRHLTQADDDHPWPDELGTGVFGQRARVTITKVRPELVLEVSADPALQGRRYRHALRYLRLRADMDPTDVDEPA